MAEAQHATHRDESPPHRYDAALAEDIEAKWQQRWADEGTFDAPNPTGNLSAGFEQVADRAKFFALDMFPYPSGTGLHVGHPLGYIGTDVYARFMRMTGHNVLHTMGYDAFGLPAEQYAIETGQHPRVTTEANIANMSRQLARLGLGHDTRRVLATTDEGYYRWTQWIFVQLFESYYDDEAGRARPITELVADLDAGEREPAADTLPAGTTWTDLSDAERRRVIDAHRLAYVSEAPVNWCPGLGTVLANEEVNAEGRSERGNFPVERRPLRQWMLRITAYAERLLGDLDLLDWPEPIKLMQRNWIGRSTGATVSFTADGGEETIEVFTTRPDTLFGATYVVLAPEHELVDDFTTAAWPEGTPTEWTGGAADPGTAVGAYRSATARRSERDRQAESHTKTGVFTGSFAINPVNGDPVPVFIADYVLTGYGTGAIMAVPAHDERDFAFAKTFGLGIVEVVRPSAAWFAEHGLDDGASVEQWPDAFTGDGTATASANDDVSLDGLAVADAKAAITAWLGVQGTGRATVTYKLRDWLFSRQRYWGEPFPIVWDADGFPHAVPAEQLPVVLPEVDDFTPRVSDDPDALPEPPLARASDWMSVTLDLGDGPQNYRREANTMPQWAGSCWYELRYLDPDNTEAFVDPEIEAYWMGPCAPGESGGVDLYVGGVEHAVLHLLYARFWHKVLYDLGHVSSVEPFHRLFNQGYVQAYAYTDDRGFYVPAADVVDGDDGTFTYEDEPVNREYGKMGKSLKNSVTPDEMYEAYGADTLRLYEMFTGPFDQSRPWNTRDVIGVHRLLQRIWRNVVDEDTGAVTVTDAEVDAETQRALHRMLEAAREGYESLRFNTVVARLTEYNNHLIGAYPDGVPRDAIEPMVLALAPLAPHIAEELGERLGHASSLAWDDFPMADPALLVDETIEMPVQINGKVRSHISVAPDATPDVLEAAARANPRIAELLAEARIDGAEVARVIAVPGRMVNLVVK
ncbi:MAG TPA: leucine--tRNA ligase [Acidimicrobiales bacterium]|nr:leucine--tRNA ligase [Acidimicrobiales bacterium]